MFWNKSSFWILRIGFESFELWDMKIMMSMRDFRRFWDANSVATIGDKQFPIGDWLFAVVTGFLPGDKQKSNWRALSKPS